MSLFQKIAIVRRLFSDTKKRARRGILIDSEKHVKVSIWLVTILAAFVVLTMFFVTPRYQMLLLLVEIGFLFVLSWLCERGRRKYFRKYYDKYDIHKQGLRLGWKIFHYALFVEQLEKSGLSNEDVRKIAECLKISETPPRQDTLLRSPVGMITLVLLVNLTLEFIKSLIPFKQAETQTYWLLWLITQIIGFLFIGSSVYNLRFVASDEAARLQLYLTWYLMEKNETSQSQTE